MKTNDSTTVHRGTTSLHDGLRAQIIGLVTPIKGGGFNVDLLVSDLRKQKLIGDMRMSSNAVNPELAFKSAVRFYKTM